ECWLQMLLLFFVFQAEDGIRDRNVTGVQTCALPILLYAAVRNILHKKGKSVEILANYEPSLHYVSEWWKQLYGESEGKDQKGIFPASVDLTTDLHSIGQFIQDGNRILYETVMNVEESKEEIIIQEEPVDLDG